MDTDRTVGSAGRAQAAWGTTLGTILIAAVLIGTAIADPGVLASAPGVPSS